MPIKIHEPWLSFLRDIDHALGQRVEIHCLGGFVLSALWELPRPTGDVDFIEIYPPDAGNELLQVAGMGSPLAKQYGLHLHRVSVAQCPEDYVARLEDMTPKGFQRLRLLALEVHDLVLAKLARNSPRDRSDVEFLVRRGVLDGRLLERRFESELRPYALNEAREKTTLQLWLEEFFGSEAP